MILMGTYSRKIIREAPSVWVEVDTKGKGRPVTVEITKTKAYELLAYYGEKYFLTLMRWGDDDILIIGG